MRITRLGAGVDANGRLDPAAIDRTVAVLPASTASVIDRLGVERVRMTATSAARDAANRDDFFDRGREGGRRRAPSCCRALEEAGLSFAGATAELDPASGPFLVVDIGGGSTEFSYGTRRVRGRRCRPTWAACASPRSTSSTIRPAPRSWSPRCRWPRPTSTTCARPSPRSAEATTFVGLAGTVTTAAAVEIGLATYDRDRIHHFVLTKEAAEDVFRTLATETRAERHRQPRPRGGPGRRHRRRACACWSRSCAASAFDACLVSEADILDGLARSLLG